MIFVLVGKKLDLWIVNETRDCFPFSAHEPQANAFTAQQDYVLAFDEDNISGSVKFRAAKDSSELASDDHTSGFLAAFELLLSASVYVPVKLSREKVPELCFLRFFFV